MHPGEDFLRFVAPGAERIVTLAGILAARGLAYQVIKTGTARHLAVRLGKGRPALILMAHYDRVPGSPGVLDNSSACLQLADFAQRVQSRPSGPEGGTALLVVFSDAEEAPGTRGADGTGGAGGQGSLALARALLAATARREAGPRADGSRPAVPPVLVLDVTGRGDRLLLSSAPAGLLARGGLGDSEAARAHDWLLGLSRRAAGRAGLAPPLALRLPWSDDLGLVLGGLGALTVSLLPDAEAAGLPSGLEPATWKLLHGPRDDLSAIEPRAFDLVASFLDAIADELV